jgi:hypothetical protein
MLLLREKTGTYKNITFFADDTDSNQFWYIPNDIHIAEREHKPIFSLLMYTGDAPNERGGYVQFEVNTALDDSELEQAFQQYLNTLDKRPENPRKSPVPFDQGTVNFFVLDAGKENGEIVSAQSPSLIGNNTAIFSAKLNETQSVIMEKAFSEAQAPAAVAYNLTYTGITPALKVEVEAKFESIYKEFDTKFGANIPIPIETPTSFWLGFDSVIKKLQQDQNLIIKVTESMPSEEETKQKEWALQFVKEEILKSFFSASIKPNDEGNEQAKSASDSILNSLIEAAKETKSLLPGGSLEIKLVKIEETKTLNFNYSESKAITQSAVPQNFIGSNILHAEKTAPYFIKINVNDPFFQTLNFTITGPDSFDNFGLKAAAFKMNYNNNVYTAPAFEDPGKSWNKELARSTNLDEAFEIQADFTFKPAMISGWEGNTSYTYKSSTTAPLYSLTPFTFLTPNTINMLIVPSFPWDQYIQVIVKLTYEDETGQSKTKQFTFNQAQSEMQTFRYRCLTEKPWKITYSLLYFDMYGNTLTREGTENPAAIVIPASAEPPKPAISHDDK